MFEPAAYFDRILPGLLTLHYSVWHRGLFVIWRDFPVFLRMVYNLGILSKGARPHFWRTFLRVLMENPFALEAFAYDCFYFYSLNQHVDYVRRELLSCLSAPSQDDVPDETARPDPPRAVVGAGTL